MLLIFRTVLFGTLALVVSGCGRSSHATEEMLRRGILSPPATLDAARSVDFVSDEVLRDLGEGLTREAPTGEIEPGVAEDWTVSADGLHYEFVLRRSARWSNGDRVTADDFVAALRRAVDPKTGSGAADLLTVVAGARSIIERAAEPKSLGVASDRIDHLCIDLARPAPYFTALLALPIAFPVHRPTLERFGDRYAHAPQFVSNGAYKLVDEGQGGRLRLERNPYYWDVAHVDVAAVEYLPVGDAQTELLRFRSGALDMTSTVPADSFEWVRQHLPRELQVRPQLGVYFFAFNLGRSPFDNKDLREALALSLDRELLIRRALKAGQVAAYSFVAPGIGGYEPRTCEWQSEPMQARLARAKELFARAGYGPAHPLKVRLLFSQSEALHNVSIVAAEQWHDALGVEVELVDREFRAFLAGRADRDSWDVLIDGWNADYPDPGNFLELFRTGAAQDDPGMRDAAYDALLDEAAAVADPTTRLARYGLAEEYLLHSYAVTPIYFPVSRRLVAERVEGAVLSPMGHTSSRYLGLRKGER